MPTIVLVHGAFSDPSIWDGVASELRAEGYRVVAVDNPLRSPASDAVIAQVHDPKVTSRVSGLGTRFGEVAAVVAAAARG